MNKQVNGNAAALPMKHRRKGESEHLFKVSVAELKESIAVLQDTTKKLDSALASIEDSSLAEQMVKKLESIMGE